MFNTRTQGEMDDLQSAVDRLEQWAQAEDRRRSTDASAKYGGVAEEAMRPVYRTVEMQGVWTIHTLDDRPLAVSAKWYHRDPRDPNWELCNEEPVQWDGEFLEINWAPGERTTIPISRVTYIEQRINEVPPPAPEPIALYPIVEGGHA